MSNIIIIDNKKKPLGFLSQEKVDILLNENKGIYRTPFLFQIKKTWKPTFSKFDMFIKKINNKYDISIVENGDEIFKISFKKYENVEKLKKYINLRNVFLEKEEIEESEIYISTEENSFEYVKQLVEQLNRDADNLIQKLNSLDIDSSIQEVKEEIKSISTEIQKEEKTFEQERKEILKKPIERIVLNLEKKPVNTQLKEIDSQVKHLTNTTKIILDLEKRSNFIIEKDIQQQILNINKEIKTFTDEDEIETLSPQVVGLNFKLPDIIYSQTSKLHKENEILGNEKKIYRIYRYKFYLDASHAIRIENKLGQRHPHTWEVVMEIKGSGTEFILFKEIEDCINEIFQPYQNLFINEINPFDTINPTTENMGEFFRKTIKEKMDKKNWVLTKFEISESPNRSYIIPIDI